VDRSADIFAACYIIGEINIKELLSRMMKPMKGTSGFHLNEFFDVICT